jgi:hypothetical protein
METPASGSRTSLRLFLEGTIDQAKISPDGDIFRYGAKVN